MSVSVLYWTIWLLCLIFGGVGAFRAAPTDRWYGGGFSLVVCVLLGLLGWATFGSPIKG
jgi:hypothetical protein